MDKAMYQYYVNPLGAFYHGTATIPVEPFVQKQEGVMPNATVHTTDVNIPVTVNTASENEAKARKYLMNRLHDIYGEKDEEARDIYHMDDDKWPKSPKELVERIKEGKFAFNDDMTKDDGTWKHDYAWRCPFDAIKWRTVPADSVGFSAWLNEARKNKQRTADDIHVLPPEKGLEALRAYEAEKVTKH